MLKAEDAVLVEILQLVANEFGVNPSKLIKDSKLTVDERLARQKKIRQIGARKMLNMLPEGVNNQADGNRDHQGLLNAVTHETGERNPVGTQCHDTREAPAHMARVQKVFSLEST